MVIIQVTIIQLVVMETFTHVDTVRIGFKQVVTVENVHRVTRCTHLFKK